VIDEWGFFCVVGSGVFSGFFAKSGVVKRGFLTVNLWWMRGELWCFDGHFLASKNTPRFVTLFLGIPHFGNAVRRNMPSWGDNHGGSILRVHLWLLQFDCPTSQASHRHGRSSRPYRLSQEPA
jgi:hypothetical protein